jgi:5-methylcytosine-specific restriction endonuclease McrA
MLNSPVLTLNTGMIPIDICNVRDAVTLQILKKAEAVKVDQDQLIRSQFLTLPLPRVIMLFNYHKIPRKRVVHSRLNIIYRDDMRCQYCGDRFSIEHLTVDHVIPLSRWREVARNLNIKPNSWENQVCACRYCNTRKGNQLISECGMKLIRKPVEPKYMPYLIISRQKANMYGWNEFLNYNVRVVEMIDTV